MRVEPHTAKSAGVVSRGLALALDTLVVAGLYGVISVGLQSFRVLVPFAAFSTRALMDVTLTVMGAFLLAAVYHASCWALVGRTVGKWALGLRVVRAGGRPIGWGRSFWRVLAYSLSALPLFLGFAWAAVDPERRALHDRLVGTRVIYAREPQRKTVRLSMERSHRSTVERAGARS